MIEVGSRTEFLVLRAEDGDLSTDDSTDFRVTSGADNLMKILVDGTAGQTTINNTTTFQANLLGRVIEITGGPGAGLREAGDERQPAGRAGPGFEPR